MVKIQLASQLRVSIKSVTITRGEWSSMDWAKILFCFCLTMSNTLSVKAQNSETKIAAEEKKTNSNRESSNSTQTAKEVLEEASSDLIKFRKPVIFRELESKESAVQNNETSAKQINKEEAKNVEDLDKAANEYSGVLTFRETPGSSVDGQWQILPEFIPYLRQSGFGSPVPIMESQSFVNKPRMSSVQINYSPSGNLKSRNVDSGSKEYSRDHSGYDDRSYPENENQPGRGHSVHTETSSDYGRFLPVNYKSKIEQEAEFLIKRKKAQNVTTPDRPQETFKNRERSQNHPERYQKPINTAFFHKGGFTDAYPFPKDHDDRRYQSEEYTKQHKPNNPETSTGEAYDTRPPISSKEAYYAPYSPPSHQHDSSPPQDSPHHKDHYPDPNYEVSHQRGLRGGNVHHEVSQYKKVFEREPHRGNSYNGDSYDSHVQKGVTSHGNNYNAGTYPADAHDSNPHHETDHGKHPYEGGKYYRHQHRDIPNHDNQNHRNPPLHYTQRDLPQSTSGQYDSSTEKYVSSYSADFEKPLPPYPETIPDSPKKQYNSPPNQEPYYYNNEENKFAPPPYTTDINIPNPHTDSLPKEYKAPYSNNPSIEPYSEPSPPPLNSKPYTEDVELNTPQTNIPYPNTALKMNDESDYYNTFKSLVDLYKSFGFQPFNLDDVSLMPPRFPFDDPYRGKIEVTGPSSASYGPTSVSTEGFNLHSKSLSYSGNVNSHGDHSYNYPPTYTEPNYNNREPTSGYANGSHEDKSKNAYYRELPYDSNRSPTVSTEHYDSPENSKPGVFHTQVESPNQSAFGGELNKFQSDYKSTNDVPPGGIEVKGIRIKDYDPETFFRDPEKNNFQSPPQPEFNYNGPPPDLPINHHSVVRTNPYNVKIPNSEEIITTYRPRVYRQQLKVETDPPKIDSELKNFYSNEKAKKFRSPGIVDSTKDINMDTERDIKPPEPLVPHGEYQQNEYNYPTSEYPANPRDKNQQWGLNSNSRQPNQSEREHRHGNRKNTQNSRKITHGEFESRQKSKSAYMEDDDLRAKRNGKRSNHKKHKSRRSRSHSDQMRAEGSTYHWGMEKHKGTEGFFQYANVPGAKAFEYGYRMGGPEHTRERHHKTKGIRSKIKVNWEDGNGDTGDHYWEFNHNSMEDEAEEPKPKKAKENIPEEADSEE